MASLVYDACMQAVHTANQGKGVTTYKHQKAGDLSRGAILTGRADRDSLEGWSSLRQNLIVESRTLSWC